MMLKKTHKTITVKKRNRAKNIRIIRIELLNFNLHNWSFDCFDRAFESSFQYETKQKLLEE